MPANKTELNIDIFYLEFVPGKRHKKNQRIPAFINTSLVLPMRNGGLYSFIRYTIPNLPPNELYNSPKSKPKTLVKVNGKFFFICQFNSKPV